MAEKTEKATPKKLRDARKKGQVAKSQDLSSAFTFIVSLAVTLALANWLYTQLASFLVATFQLVHHGELFNILPELMKQAIMVIFLVSLPILGIVSMVGVTVEFLSVGPTFATEVFKPDIKKFNPVENIKAKFKIKTLVELLKSLFKIGVASYIIYGVMLESIPVLIMTVSLPITGALLVFKAFLMEVIIKIGLFFILVAIMDFIFQKQNFAKEMKMEKFEVKQEYKNTEGDPLIKSKRKEIAREIAYQEGPAGSLRRAKAVVTNPTHLAIALGYEKDKDAAPYILAMGSGFNAENIIKLAERYNVPVLRNVPLAHKLWEKGELWEYVPEESYEAIAEILRWIASMQPEANLAGKTNELD